MSVDGVVFLDYQMVLYVTTAVAEDTGLPSGGGFILTFLDGSTNQIQCAEVPIISDEELEGDHAFTVNIVSAGSSPHAIVNTPSSTTTVTIEDDERKLVVLFLC